MAAFTEGFSYQENNNKIGTNIVSKIKAARLMAQNERKYAEKVLAAKQKNVPDDDKLKLEDFGIEKGYFFRKALKHEFGGDYVSRKKEKLSSAISKTKLLKNPRRNFSKLFEKRKPTTKLSRFRKQFDYNFQTSDSAVKATSPKIPGTIKKIQKVTAGSGKRISKEQLLESLSDILKSIQAIATSIQSSSDEVKQNIISSNIAQTNIAEQLKLRNDTLSDKLDKIADAISKNTLTHKQVEQKKQNKQRESELEQKNDVAGTSAFDDLTTSEDESKQETNVDQDIVPTSSITNIQNLTPDAYSQRDAWREQNISQRNFPQMERGGIISGPDSGYLANLSPGDTVIPLDNNFTQGEPSAVDGKVRKFETGTSGVGGKFGFGITRNLGIGNTFASSITNMSQPLVDAMSLPMMVAGGSVIAATTNLMKNLGDSGEELRPEIEKFSRPIADAFGVPPTVMNKAKAGTVKEKKEKDKVGAEVSGESKKNIIAKIMDGFGKLLENMGNSINQNQPPPPGDTISSAPGEAKLAAFVATMESSTLQDQADVMQSMINRAGQNYSGYGGLFGQLTAPNQYSPLSAAIHGTTDPHAQAKYGPVADKLGKTPAERIAKIKEIIAQPDGLSQLQALFGGISDASAAKTLVDDFYSGGPLSKEAARLIQGRTDFGAASGVGGAQGAGQIRRTSNTFAAANASRGASLLTAVAPQPTSQPAATQTPTPTSTSLGQQITENYGMNVNDKFYFKLGGVEYHAYKTTKGFDFYKGTTKITDKKEEQKVIQGFVNLKTQALQRAATEVSLAPPSSRDLKLNQTQQLNKTQTSDSSSSVAYLNLPAPSNKPSLNSSQPTASNASLSEAYNPLNNSGLYLA